MTYYRCGKCGCTTHYTTREDDGSETTAINARMVAAEAIAAIPRRNFDGADSWTYLDE